MQPYTNNALQIYFFLIPSYLLFYCAKEASVSWIKWRKWLETFYATVYSDTKQIVVDTIGQWKLQSSCLMCPEGMTVHDFKNFQYK